MIGKQETYPPIFPQLKGHSVLLNESDYVLPYLEVGLGIDQGMKVESCSGGLEEWAKMATIDRPESTVFHFPEMDEVGEMEKGIKIVRYVMKIVPRILLLASETPTPATAQVHRTLIREDHMPMAYRSMYGDWRNTVAKRLARLFEKEPPNDTP